MKNGKIPFISLLVDFQAQINFGTHSASWVAF
jgi:hypothetical protein